MKPFVIVTDSGSDLSRAMATEFGVDIVYLGAELDGKAVDVSAEEGIQSFYDGMRSDLLTKTFAANSKQFMEAFEKHLKDGKDLVYVGFSSALSGTFAASSMAKEELSEKYPDSRIELIDTKCASLGEGLAVYYASEMQKNGATLDEVVSFLLGFCPKICQRFTVDDLVYLKRGGRISSVTAALGTLLSIKPILHVNDEGKLISLRKARGRKKAVEALFEDMRTLSQDPAEHTVFISHADCLEDAQSLSAMIEQEFHPKKIVVGNISPVIGAHSGPGTLALFFYGSAR